MNVTIPFRTYSSPSYNYYNLFLATSCKAYFGHGKNQSIIVQLTKAGNCLALLLRASPTGEKHKDICNLALTLSIK